MKQTTNLLLIVVMLSVTACGSREYKSDLKRMEEDKKSCDILEGKYVVTTRKLFNDSYYDDGRCIFNEKEAVK